MKMWSFVSILEHDGHIFAMGSRFASTELVGNHDATNLGVKRLRYFPLVVLPKESQSMDSNVV